MRTLRNHIILYDEECPMCKAYTRGFVKAGMLGDEGRQSYQQVPAAFCPLIDKQRAADEIALVNTETGTVSYGIDSLFTVIGHSSRYSHLCSGGSPSAGWPANHMLSFPPTGG